MWLLGIAFRFPVELFFKLLDTKLQILHHTGKYNGWKSGEFITTCEFVKSIEIW